LKVARKVAGKANARVGKLVEMTVVYLVYTKVLLMAVLMVEKKELYLVAHLVKHLVERKEIKKVDVWVWSLVERKEI